MNVSLRSGAVVVSVLALVSLRPATADEFLLEDNNSSVIINTELQSGVSDWIVDGTDHLFQQWYWLRAGSAGPEASLDTLAILSQFASDSTGNGLNDRLVASYAGSGYQVDIRLSLVGGAPGSGGSLLNESIEIINTGNQNLSFSFFQYNDYDMAGSAANDRVALINDNTWRQSEIGGVTLQESAVTPAGARHEAAFWPATLNSLNDGGPTTLSNAGGPLDGDVTFTWQWDFNLSPADSFQISKIRSIVPEPATALLLIAAAPLLLRRR